VLFFALVHMVVSRCCFFLAAHDTPICLFCFLRTAFGGEEGVKVYHFLLRLNLRKRGGFWRLAGGGVN